MSLEKVLTIGEMKERARRRVPKLFFDYADSGALTESTYRGNEADFARVLLRQRVARKLNDRSLATTMIGQDVAMPLALAPTGLCGMQHADGEIHAARAAEKAGVPFTLSTMSICSIEDVAANSTKPFWFQLYVIRDRDFTKNLLDRAKAAGVSALVLTMDLQLMAQRHKDVRNGLSTPPRMTPKHLFQMMTKPLWCMKMLGTRRHTFRNIAGHAKNVDDLAKIGQWTSEQFDPELSWDDVSWIKDYWGGPLIIKGVLDVEDARAAAGTGADAVIVSNHGGRQLDGAPSSIRVLPEIVNALEGKVEVHVDGGIRSGQDLLKVRALGAQAGYIGRPFLYGLGAGGERGVTRVFDIMRQELDTTMALCGERDINAVGRHNIYSVDF